MKTEIMQKECFLGEICRVFSEHIAVVRKNRRRYSAITTEIPGGSTKMSLKVELNLAK